VKAKLYNFSIEIKSLGQIILFCTNNNHLIRFIGIASFLSYFLIFTVDASKVVIIIAFEKPYVPMRIIHVFVAEIESDIDKISKVPAIELNLRCR
jgi:hypothetical protein